MISLVVVENVRRFPLELEGAQVVTAREYLTDPRWASQRRVAVYNLCRRYGYQSLGYYVSLLAQARGHRALPSVSTLQSLGSSAPVRIAGEELEPLIQRSLSGLRSAEFSLSIYFGRNVAGKYDRLARALFNQFPAPLLRARFRFLEPDGWTLVGVRPIPTSEIPDEHRDFVLEQARRFFRRRPDTPRAEEYRYTLAILWNEDDPSPPSEERAIRKFVRAARDVGIQADVLSRDEVGRIAEYDALFLRETTRVEHHTYRLARRALREGLVVLDHPDDILRCTNKVYQAELFARHGVPAPRTLVVHEGNVDQIPEAVGLPCVLKRPDGAFSQGVVKAHDTQELARIVPALLEESDLVVAQEWTPSPFDWRIGVLGGEALWGCRYHMVSGHWQIAQAAVGKETRFGRVEALPLADVPRGVVEAAVQAARLMGDGLYGVDVKEVDGRVLVIEVNDNPNLDAGYEDGVLKDELYAAIMGWFRRRLEARGRNSSREGGA